MGRVKALSFLLVLVALQAQAGWETESKYSRQYTVPLGTPCADAEVETTKDATGRVRSYHNVQVRPGVVVPFACVEVQAPPPVVTPPPPPPVVTPPAPALVFSTSFDRTTDWSQASPDLPMPSADPRLLVGRYGGWTLGGTCSASGCTGQPDQIIDAANRPGSPGKGFRHWRGAGTNVGGGGVSVSTGQLPEFWLRYWIRYQPGFQWVNGKPHYTKDFYINVGGSNPIIIGFQGGGYGVHYLGKNYSAESWASTMADGAWHCVEVHASASKIEVWRNGTQTVNANATLTPTWAYFVIGSNQNQVVGGPWYTDYDDIAISSSGRIGCQ